MSQFLGGCKVLRNDEIGQNIYSMELECEEVAQLAQPGQFVHIRMGSFYDPLLRRPFSIHDTERKNFKLVYEVVGKGSRILSETPPGVAIDVLGPLGKGFEIGESQGTYCMVAGGIGIAPLYFLTKKLKARTDRLIGFIGAKTSDKLIGDTALRSMGIEVFTSTEDGSSGFKGLITELFEKIVERRNFKELTLYACGPKEMLKSLAEISDRRGFKAQVSLEEFMACGMGACLGCGVKLKSGEYRMVCKDGPVFWLDEVTFDG